MAREYTIRAIMSATYAIGDFQYPTKSKLRLVDSEDKAAMDEAAHHANNVIPDNLSKLKFMLYAFTPESIRFKYDLSPMPL